MNAYSLAWWPRALDTTESATEVALDDGAGIDASLMPTRRNNPPIYVCRLWATYIVVIFAGR